MYRDFYGLVRKPFEMTPDPSFLVLSPAIARASRCSTTRSRRERVSSRSPAKSAPGKTTLVHALLSQLKSSMPSAFIFNPRVEPLDFLRMLFDEFHIEHSCRTKAEYLMALNHFLIDCLRRDQIALLIIDEAQNLSPEMLEEVRLLSNLETPTSKLLQILLVGQPELNEMLDRPSCASSASGSCCATTWCRSTPRSSTSISTSGCGLRAIPGKGIFKRSARKELFAGDGRRAAV
jgi:type II secretory pathway predicted ATPase ExeA